MACTAQQRKLEIRREMRERLLLRGTSGSDALCRLLQSSELYTRAKVLVAFMPIMQEPLILPLLGDWLKSGRKLYLPLYCKDRDAYTLAETLSLNEDGMIPGKYGIPEPLCILPESCNPCNFGNEALWLVPGLAFSPVGGRLGRGKGYYDRLLKNAGGLKVGALFENQLRDDIPAEQQDVCMDYLLTETRLINCSGRSRSVQCP